MAMVLLWWPWCCCGGHGVAVVAMTLSGVVVDVALPGIAVVDETLPGVAVVTMVLPGVAVGTMVLLW